MPKVVQIRRQGAPDVDTYVGPESELIHDLANGTLRIHDGATAGGTRLSTFAETVAGAAASVATANAYTDIAIQRPDLVIVVTADIDLSTTPVDSLYQNGISLVVQPAAAQQIIVTIPDSDHARFIDGYRITIHHDGDAQGTILLKTPDAAPDTDIDLAPELLIASAQTTVTVLISTAQAKYQLVQDSRPKEAVGLTLYATTTADPILAGYTVGVVDITDVRYDAVAVEIDSPVITDAAISHATAILSGIFITDADVFGVVSGDIVTTALTSIVGNANRTARTWLELYVRDAGGTETLIGETADGALITDVPHTMNNTFSAVEYAPQPGDRIVVRSYVFKDATTGADPTLRRTFGGTPPTNALRAVVPQSLSAVQSGGTGGGPSLGLNSVIRVNDTNIKEDIIVRDNVEAVIAETVGNTVDAGTADDYNEGDVVYLTTTGTLPAPLSVDTAYYAKAITSATMQLAETFDGAAIDITDLGTGDHTMYKAINGISAGPITIETGSTVTIPTGSTWSIE